MPDSRGPHCQGGPWARDRDCQERPWIKLSGTYQVCTRELAESDELLPAVRLNIGEFKIGTWYTSFVARARKRHVQTELPFRPHGGKRVGAGRPCKGPRPSERHQRRPVVRASEPVHVVSRVVRDVGRLRTRHMYAAVREATIAVLALERFRIAHLSIQGSHLHLIVEAHDRLALADGMKRFLISAAKQINRSLRERTGNKRRGPVFVDRYHPRILRTPREVRNCIAYVLNNWRHHGEDQRGVARRWAVDPFSSGVSFDGWRELEDSPVMYRPPPTYAALAVWLPKTWLLAKGWTRHGRIGVREVPGGSHDE